MLLKDKMKTFPDDIIFNYSNNQILREMSREDLTKIKKPLYIFFRSFDILEFPYNKFKNTGIITARHSPKKIKFLMGHDFQPIDEWSFYYDRYVRKNEYDFYHRRMSSIKRTIKEYIKFFYDPFHQVNVNMSIIKTTKDILEKNNVEYTFVKPDKREWWLKSNNEWMDTASEEVTEHINNHELNYLLKENIWITRGELKTHLKEKYNVDYNRQMMPKKEIMKYD